jgi:hypothetical protein
MKLVVTILRIAHERHRNRCDGGLGSTNLTMIGDRCDRSQPRRHRRGLAKACLLHPARCSGPDTVKYQFDIFSLAQDAAKLI